MQPESINRQALAWKKLENNIRVTQFISASTGKDKVYVKRFDALKKDPHRNITIFLLHDVGQYHGRFLSFINWTRNRHPGISFVAMDFVGHGLSSGTRGHIQGFETLVEDFLFLLNHSDRNSDAHEKWLIMGQGLGGLVALDLVNRHPELVEQKISGLILSNFILRFSSALLEIENQMTDALSGLKKLAGHFRPIRVLKGEDMLSLPLDILSYEQDPLVVHRPTLITIKEIQNKVANIYQDSYFIGKPLLLLKSERDNLINAIGIDYFAKGVKKELLTEKKYSLMKHDLYNESDKEIVFQDIIGWMKIYEN